MSGKNMKILRKGSRLYKLPYSKVKRAFKHLEKPDRQKFLDGAREVQYA